MAVKKPLGRPLKGKTPRHAYNISLETEGIEQADERVKNSIKWTSRSDYINEAIKEKNKREKQK